MEITLTAFVNAFMKTSIVHFGIQCTCMSLVNVLYQIDVMLAVSAVCPPDYQEQPGSGYCFGLFEKDKQTGTNAQTKCEEQVANLPGMGSLASVRDKETWNWIMTTFQTRLATITNNCIG